LADCKGPNRAVTLRHRQAARALRAVGGQPQGCGARFLAVEPGEVALRKQARQALAVADGPSTTATPRPVPASSRISPFRKDDHDVGRARATPTGVETICRCRRRAGSGRWELEIGLAGLDPVWCAGLRAASCDSDSPATRAAPAAGARKNSADWASGSARGASSATGLGQIRSDLEQPRRTRKTRSAQRCVVRRTQDGPAPPASLQGASRNRQHRG